MTDIHPAILDIAPSVANTICRRFRNYVDRDDVKQECYAWYLTRVAHLDELLNETNTIQKVINEKRIAWQMKRHCERYARKEKAAKSGYVSGDEYFYETSTLAQMLPHILGHIFDGAILEQAQQLIDDGSPKHTSAPAEGRGLLAMLIDIKRGYLQLEQDDQMLLRLRHHERFTLQQIAQVLECATSTADRRCDKSLRRLQDNLGGISPWQ